MLSINLRLPAELHVALKALAVKDHRSLNSEIVALLEAAVRDRDADSPAG